MCYGGLLLPIPNLGYWSDVDDMNRASAGYIYRCARGACAGGGETDSPVEFDDAARRYLVGEQERGDQDWVRLLSGAPAREREPRGDGAGAGAGDQDDPGGGHALTPLALFDQVNFPKATPLCRGRISGRLAAPI